MVHISGEPNISIQTKKKHLVTDTAVLLYGTESWIFLQPEKQKIKTEKQIHCFYRILGILLINGIRNEATHQQCCNQATTADEI